MGICRVNQQLNNFSLFLFPFKIKKECPTLIKVMSNIKDLRTHTIIIQSVEWGEGSINYDNKLDDATLNVA